MVHRLYVFTFKEGLLSRVAHDLCLELERFTIELEGSRVRAALDPSSLVVEGVMDGARLDRGALRPADRAKIVNAIQDKILHTRRHPSVRFDGQWRLREDGGLAVEGELELVGRRRPISWVMEREGERYSARVTLRPSEFGIPPYKALAGAIRLQDKVVVELELDADALGLEG